MQLLLVEDDPILGLALQVGLGQDGVAVDWRRHGIDVVASFDSSVHEALVLDLGLPDIDGFEVLHHVRRSHPDLPIVIVTARLSVEDRIRGLDSGADDYLVKPFELVELLARLRAVRRRLERSTAPSSPPAALKLDTQNHLVAVGDRRVELNAGELHVLQLLIGCQTGLSGRWISRRLLDCGEDVDPGAVEHLLGALRAKLGIAIRQLPDGWHCGEVRILH